MKDMYDRKVPAYLDPYVVEYKFKDYQEDAIYFDTNKEKSNNGFIEKVLGLGGEAGEVQEKIKKVIRDKDFRFDSNDKLQIAKELGDVLWYLSVIATYLDLHLENIARQNLLKLYDRQKRDKIKGSGDDR